MKVKKSISYDFSIIIAFWGTGYQNFTLPKSLFCRTERPQFAEPSGAWQKQWLLPLSVVNNATLGKQIFWKSGNNSWWRFESKQTDVFTRVEFHLLICSRNKKYQSNMQKKVLFNCLNIEHNITVVLLIVNKIGNWKFLY